MGMQRTFNTVLLPVQLFLLSVMQCAVSVMYCATYDIWTSLCL